MSKRIAIVLSGCGFLDGAEIHESVMTLLYVLKNGARPHFFAPNVNQHHTTNHLTKEETTETRNVLIESARIARCDVKALDQLKAQDFDAVIFPGGFGAALNLCDFGIKGADCSVNPDVERVILDFHKIKKPIGVICVAPAVTAKVLGTEHVEVTVGSDQGTAQNIENTGARHIIKAANEIHVDEKNRIVSTPAYMLAKNILEVEDGVAMLVKKILSMC